MSAAATGVVGAAYHRVATAGDGWMPLWISSERLAEGSERVSAAAHGRAVTVAVVLPALIGGTTEEARLYLSRRYNTAFSAHAIERYCLAGPPSACAERIGEYVAAGAEHIVFNPAVEPGRLAEQIELLADVTHAAAR